MLVHVFPSLIKTLSDCEDDPATGAALNEVTQSICRLGERESLRTIGEWWSLLIVRDALSGIRRFSDFQKSLGLAKNILSARLKKLVARGIMERVPASDGSAYQEYSLTPKGRELFPVIVALRQWEKVISSPAGRNVFRFWTNAPESPLEWKCKTRKGKPLRRTIWNWLLLRVEQTFTASNILATPERTDCRASGGFPAWSEQMFEPCWHALDSIC